MSNPIKELEKMILNPDAKLSVILQHALIVANKFDKNSVTWIKQEINGYKMKKGCPKYRKVYGDPKAMDEHGSWKPYICENDKEREALSNRLVPISVSALENSIKASATSKTISVTFIYDKKFALVVQQHAIISILDKIRSNLLDWVINLNTKEEHSSSTASSDIIFPQELISRLPKDLKILANDFNFNFSNNRTYTCMLILRRMLPLSIVRRFQRDKKEGAIKKDGEYLNTSDLLAKTDPLIGNKLSTSLRSRKMLLDSSQHLYGFHPAIHDVERAADALRLFLGEFFPDKDNKNQ